MLENEIESINKYSDKINKMLSSIDIRVLMSAYLATGASAMSNVELRNFIDVIASIIISTAVSDTREVLSLNKERNEMVKRLTL